MKVQADSGKLLIYPVCLGISCLFVFHLFVLGFFVVVLFFFASGWISSNVLLYTGAMGAQ